MRRHRFFARLEADYQAALEAGGFEAIRFFPSLVGTEVSEESQAANRVITARKPRQSGLTHSPGR